MLEYAKLLVKERAAQYLRLFHYFADDLAAYGCIYNIPSPARARQFLLHGARKELQWYLEARDELGAITRLQDAFQDKTFEAYLGEAPAKLFRRFVD